MVCSHSRGCPRFCLFLRRRRSPASLYLFIYTRITAHDEFELDRARICRAPRSRSASACSASRCRWPARSRIRRTSSTARSGRVIALIVQIVVYYIARIPVPDLSQRIEHGEIAPAIWLGLASLTRGLINAA